MTATNEDFLAEQIRYHSELYFNGVPEIGDAEFDDMVKELKGLNPNHPVLAEVGADPTYGKKVKHPSVMGSLSKATYGEENNDISELMKWRKEMGDNVKIACMPKIDGLAVRLNFTNGKLDLAATRGNGAVGQDVTDNVKNIKSIPSGITSIVNELRGELYMKKSDFITLRQEMINNDEKKIPAHPRNMASGTLNQKNPTETGKHPLHFFAYNVFGNLNCKTEEEQAAFINDKCPGFNFVPVTVGDFNTEAEFLKVIRDWEAKRDSLDYGIDGLVFAVNDIDTQEDLGYNGKCPVGKIAFKFRPVQATSKILDIDWQLGRTGKLTPVAKIVPTLVDGSTIESPTLHNLAMIKKKNVSIGATVVIEKAGDIIPQVVRVTEVGTGNINQPNICPACLGDVESDDTTLWCRNPICPGKAELRISHYIKTLEIQDVGPATVCAMLDAGLINDIPDLYSIDFEKLSSLPGFGKKSARKVVKEIFDKREVELAVFLAALGISGLGRTTSKLLADKYENLDAAIHAPFSELVKLEGIGEITAVAIRDGFRSQETTINNIIAAGVIVKDVEKKSGNLNGLSFCVTGTLSVGRKEIQNEIENNGGIIKSSVGKGLDYLVAGDGVGQGKTEKAAKYGTKVISEAELRAMI